MNILLFEHRERLQDNPDFIRIDGERFEHITQVQKFVVGDSLVVGEINGDVGEGEIVEISEDACLIEIHLTDTPPAHPEATVIMALPRPKMLKRILVDLSMVGIKHIVIMNSFGVQKSYWNSPLLTEESLRNYCLRGLEQSRDTLLPTITLEKRFKPFIEDRFETLCQGSQGHVILAQPDAEKICPQPINAPFTLIIGPESGFIPYEVDLMSNHGATAYTVGHRHLRVETAAMFLLGRLL